MYVSEAADMPFIQDFLSVNLSEFGLSQSLSCVQPLVTPTDLPGSSVLGIFQAGILEWVAISSS